MVSRFISISLLYHNNHINIFSGAGGQHDSNVNGFYVVWRDSALLDNNDHLNFSVSKGKKTFHVPVKVTILGH